MNPLKLVTPDFGDFDGDDPTVLQCPDCLGVNFILVDDPQHTVVCGECDTKINVTWELEDVCNPED